MTNNFEGKYHTKDSHWYHGADASKTQGMIYKLANNAQKTGRKVIDVGLTEDFSALMIKYSTPTGVYEIRKEFPELDKMDGPTKWNATEYMNEVFHNGGIKKDVGHLFAEETNRAINGKHPLGENKRYGA